MHNNYSERGVYSWCTCTHMSVYTCGVHTHGVHTRGVHYTHGVHMTQVVWCDTWCTLIIHSLSFTTAPYLSVSYKDDSLGVQVDGAFDLPQIHPEGKTQYLCLHGSRSTCGQNCHA